VRMSRGTVAAIATVGVLAAAVITGLVAFVLGHSPATAPKGGALLNLDGVAAVAPGGRAVSVKLGGDAPQHFAGTTGCASRHFVAYYGGSTNQPLLVAYSATQATVAFGANVFRFDEGPSQQNGDLMWQGDFGPSGAFSQIALAIGCPPP
jgi:hypothetical protein